MRAAFLRFGVKVGKMDDAVVGLDDRRANDKIGLRQCIHKSIRGERDRPRSKGMKPHRSIQGGVSDC